MVCVYCFCRRDSVSSGAFALKRAHSDQDEARAAAASPVAHCFYFTVEVRRYELYVAYPLYYFININAFVYVCNYCHPKGGKEYIF